jgi:hypothetical protein
MGTGSSGQTIEESVVMCCSDPTTVILMVLK